MERFLISLDLIDAILDGDLDETLQERWEFQLRHKDIFVSEATALAIFHFRSHSTDKRKRWQVLLAQLKRLPAPVAPLDADSDPWVVAEQAAARTFGLRILCWQAPQPDPEGLYHTLATRPLKVQTAVPFLDLKTRFFDAPEEISQALLQTAASGWYVMGRAVERFEDAWARYLDSQWAVGVSNGLDGLHIALRALNISRGDEVIVPANTYIATWLAITYTGAKPVPVDPNPETMVIGPDEVAPAINKRTRAILPVHLYGHPCDMSGLMRLAEGRELLVVEDNAQSQGAAWRGRKTGTWGHLNATSLYPTKNLGAMGDAGVLSGNDHRLLETARRLRNYGSDRKYYNEIIGMNHRLDELQAAVLLPILSRLDSENDRRREAADRYSKGLQGIGDLILPIQAPEAHHVWHQYVIRTRRRDGLMYFLQEQGIGTLIHYPVPPHLQQAYKYLGHEVGSFPISESIAQTCLSLPMNPSLTEAQTDHVIALIKDFYE